MMEIKTYFDPKTSTLTYVVYDSESKDALVIDPVMDYDPIGSKVSHESVDAVIAFVESQGLKLHWVLETHAHADHLSGAQVIRERFPEARIAIGQRITEVQALFKSALDLPEDFPTDGRQFDRLLADGERISAGSFEIELLFTPGHTPACGSYRIGDAVFTGDALFMPDMGTGRCDFPAGSAHDLFRSIKDRLYRLEDTTRVFVGHDYQPGGRALAWESTIGEQKRSNIQLKETTILDDFVRFRTERDKALSAPKLLFQSIQVNIDAGRLPQPASNQKRYLKIPVNIFRPEGSLGREVEQPLDLHEAGELHS